MLKGLGFKLQVRVDYRKGKSHSAKLDWSRIWLECSRIAKKGILRNFKSGSNPWKRLEFHSNLFTYKKETLTMFFRLLEDLCVIFCEIWEVMYILTTQESTRGRSTIKHLWNIVATSRSLLMVIWNLWMRSQSHKQGCLCWCKSKKRWSLWIRSLHVVVFVSYYMR